MTKLRCIAVSTAALLLIGITTSVTASAQNDAGGVSLTLSGFLQTESSFGWTTHVPEDRARVGIGLRRVRLRTTATVGPRAGAQFQLAGDTGDFAALDVFAFYDFTPAVRLRVGRMPSAQPRALIRTSALQMDAAERAAIALRWNGGTLGSSGRDFGVDVALSTETIDAVVFIHNGDGSFDALRGNFRQNIAGDVTGGVDRPLRRLAASAYAAYRPPSLAGVEVGGFAGVNGARNPNTAVDGVGRDYATYSMHAYWGSTPGSQPLRLKADVVGIRYRATAAIPAQRALGASFLAAAAIHRSAEVFSRVETFDASTAEAGDRTLYVTVGSSFSLSDQRGQAYARERLTLSYSTAVAEIDTDANHHLLTLQLQVAF